MKLNQISLSEYVRELASAGPTPGGGSAAALCGAMGAALAAMVAGITSGKEKFRDVWQDMEKIKGEADELSERFIRLAEEDSEAYEGVLAALRLPKASDQEAAARDEALQKAMKRATLVPLETLRAAESLVRLAGEAMEKGIPSALTDAGAAIYLGKTAAVVASQNVRVNLPGIRDESFVLDCREEMEIAMEQIEALYTQADAQINARLP